MLVLAGQLVRVPKTALAVVIETQTHTEVPLVAVMYSGVLEVTVLWCV